MGLIDNLFGFFGYSRIEDKKQPVSKNDRDEKPDSGRSVSNPDDYAYIQMNDYWGNKIKKELYVDGKDGVRYEEFNQMDLEVPEIKAALDVNADYIIYPNTDDDESRVVKVMHDDPEIQAKIDEIETRVSLQEKLFPMVRAMLKYGDNFEELVTNVAGNKFLGFRNIPIKTCIPVLVNGFPASVGEVLVQEIDGHIHTVFQDTEIFHLCMNTDRERFTKYGKGQSMLENSRTLYKQVKLMEEGMMITRLSRANQNYAMIVDVGELQGKEALDFLDMYKKRIMRRKYYDPRTGKFNWDYNPLSIIEDIMVPTRQGSGGNVIPLTNTGNSLKDIDDIKYCQDKLIYSTGTPKLLIGKENDLNSKSTSDNQVAGFLRRIRRIQTIIAPQIKKLYKNILLIEGVDVNENDLRISYPTGLTVDEERKATIAKLRAQVAEILKTNMMVVDDMYVYTKILGMTDAEAEELKARVEVMRDEEDERRLRQSEAQAEIQAKNKENPNSAPNTNKNKTGEGDDESGWAKWNREHGKESLNHEKLMKIMEEKLTPEQFKSWQEHMEMCKKNPNLMASVTALIDILQSYDGN